MNTKKFQISNFKFQRGYTLLFAVITAALVLGVGVFILGVSKKQYALSVTARESMYALYAADSAIECVAGAYRTNKLATTSPSGIVCNGVSVAAVSFSQISNPDTSLWSNTGGKIEEIKDVFIGLQEGTCALVTATYGPNKSDQLVLRIVSRGYNQCDVSGPTPSSRTVERALRLTIKGV